MSVAVAPGAGCSTAVAVPGPDAFSDANEIGNAAGAGIEIPALAVAEGAVDMRKGKPHLRQRRRFRDRALTILMIARLKLGCFRTMVRLQQICRWAEIRNGFLPYRAYCRTWPAIDPVDFESMVDIDSNDSRMASTIAAGDRESTVTVRCDSR